MKKFFGWVLALGLLAAPLALTQRAGAQVDDQGYYGGGGAYDNGYAYGPAPVCQWGYYNYYPYSCAPYGFYGPSWFIGGLFIGAGPWFHGYRGGFYGRPGFGRPGLGGRPGWGGRPGFGGREVGRGSVGRG